MSEVTELGERWLAALRGGEYRRGRRRLLRSYCGFCALGVLCDLVDANGWDGNGFWWYGHQRSIWYPPLAVLSLVGLTRSQASQVAAASDSDGLSAAADVAERLMSGAAA